MPLDPTPRQASVRREIAERLIAFFLTSADGRSANPDLGAAIASSQGPHRERNEDRCAIVRFRFGSTRPDLRLAILCDGMGGMAKGGEAASLALASFVAAFATISPDCALPERLEESCRFANFAVHNAFLGQAGTTLTSIAFGVNARWAVHVGDSRLYGLTEKKSVDLLTQDDTVSGAVNAHLGNDDEDDMDNRLLQFVGIGDQLNPHLIQLSRDYEHTLWLITSDGAHGVGRKALSGICEGSRNPLDLVRKLVYVSEAINTQDNATAICIRSGHVQSLEEVHEGLTIQITAPDRNLDIWMPSSAMREDNQGALSAGSRSPEISENLISEAEQLPRRMRVRGERARKSSPRKKRGKANGTELPLDIVFENGGDDD